MSTKTTTKKSNGANSATSKNSKKVVTNKSGKVTGVTVIELTENAEAPVTGNVTEQPIEVVMLFVVYPISGLFRSARRDFRPEPSRESGRRRILNPDRRR